MLLHIASLTIESPEAKKHILVEAPSQDYCIRLCDQLAKILNVLEVSYIRKAAKLILQGAPVQVEFIPMYPSVRFDRAVTHYFTAISTQET
jgi:hypothetical protein